MSFACALLHLLAALALLAFWYAYALLLPFARLEQGIWHLARDRHWTWISALGGAGTVLASLALVLLWRLEPALAGATATLGVLLAVAGLALLGANLFWEAILWPVLAEHDEGVLAFDGPIYTSKILLGFFALAGLAFAAGYVLVGLALREAPGAALPAWGLVIGAPLFALGPMFGRLQVVVRSVGITALALSLAWLGVAMPWT